MLQTSQPLLVSDLVVIWTAAASVATLVATAVLLALKLQNFINGKFTAVNEKFEQHRKLMYAMFGQRDRAIRRLEFWAVKQRSDPPYQPTIDPPGLYGKEDDAPRDPH